MVTDIVIGGVCSNSRRNGEKSGECVNKIQASELENESLTNELKTSREANLKLKSERNTNKTIYH